MAATKFNRTIHRIISAPLAADGEGVVIHRAFPNHELSELDPFLLLDHLGPTDLRPGEAKGFPNHPHRGFETVTYLLDGEMQHRDSFGNHGVLRPGDVQWMTAGSGLVHSEMPGDDLVKHGGRLQGFQVWVNLPRHDKMTPPRYQEFSADRIPVAQSDTGDVEVRVIAGTALGVKGAVETHTPIQYLHFTLRPGAHVTQVAPREQNAVLYVIDGHASVAGRSVSEHHSVLFAGDADQIEFGNADAKRPLNVLLLTGEPLNEPIARYGPFVMNTKEELYQAFEDYRAGRMGEITVTK